MSRIGNALKALAGIDPKPQEMVTRVVSGGTEKNPFVRLGLVSTDSWNDPMRILADRVKAVKAWRRIYLQGGPVAECIDSYPLFALSNGWELQCEEGADGLKDKVQEWLDQPNVDLDSVMWQGIVDACVCGTAFQEIVPTQGGGVWGVVPRDASSFWVEFNEIGKVTGYKQLTYQPGGSISQIKIDENKIDRILTLTLFPVSGEIYGISLIGRAYDDILRDLDVIESVTKSIHRHGTPKQQWNAGSKESPVSQADMEDIRKEIKKVSADTDFVTTNTEIKMLDTSGVPGIDSYSNITLTRLATALGVPEEILGLGRGSTEATATVRQRAFYDKISTIQEIVARTYTRKVIDRITGQPGKVWIEFNDPSPEDMLKKAQMIAALRQGMDPDAVFPASYCREQFGVPPDEDEEKMGDPARKIPAADQTTLPTEEVPE